MSVPLSEHDCVHCISRAISPIVFSFLSFFRKCTCQHQEFPAAFRYDNVTEE